MTSSYISPKACIAEACHHGIVMIIITLPIMSHITIANRIRRGSDMRKRHITLHAHGGAHAAMYVY